MLNFITLFLLIVNSPSCPNTRGRHPLENFDNNFLSFLSRFGMNFQDFRTFLATSSSRPTTSRNPAQRISAVMVQVSSITQQQKTDIQFYFNLWLKPKPLNLQYLRPTVQMLPLTNQNIVADHDKLSRDPRIVHKEHSNYFHSMTSLFNKWQHKCIHPLIRSKVLRQFPSPRTILQLNFWIVLI